MKILSMGLIAGKVVKINWVRGEFQCSNRLIGERLDRMLEQKKREAAKIGQEINTEDTDFAVMMIFKEIYDHRLSVFVSYDEE